MTIDTRQFDADGVRVLAALARLDVPPQRVPALARELTEMYADLDQLASVPLGETPPATAFDARWRWTR